MERYNPTSGWASDYVYVFTLRTDKMIYMFSSNKQDFNVGDTIEFQLNRDKVQVSNGSGKSRDYPLRGIEEVYRPTDVRP